MRIKDKFKILTYNVGFIYKPIYEVLESGIRSGDIVWMNHTYKDRYFADPFMIDEDVNNYYVLCEEYPFWSEIGKIVLLTISRDNHELLGRKMIIDEPYHLSFPYCKLHGDWILPEASASGAAYIYKYDTQKQEVTEKRKISDVGLIDNVSYNDKSGKYLYAGKTRIPSTELYEFQMDEDGLYKEVRLIQSDNRTSRGAGDFFTINDKLYRAVQDCKGRYGRQTKIMQFEAVGEKGYHATEAKTVNSFDNPPFNETMHTFNVYDDVIVIDGSKDFVRFPMKFFYKKCRWLFKKRMSE